MEIYNCQGCAYWKRWKTHSDLPKQHEWGDCKRLSDPSKCEDLFSVGHENEDCWPEYIHIETHQHFFCSLFLRRLK